MSAQIEDTPFHEEAFIRYFEGNANPQLIAYTEMNYPMYIEWLNERRKNWLRSERGYQDLEFLRSMSEKNICSLLNQLVCPFDVTTKLTWALRIQASRHIHIVPLDHENNNGNIEHNIRGSCTINEAWKFRQYFYFAVDDTTDECREVRAYVEANYPRFLAWLEFKRECYLLDKVVSHCTSLTWFRELDENSKCHLLRNFQDCHYANNRFYFSHLNSNRQGLPIEFEPLYESDISSDPDEVDPDEDDSGKMDAEWEHDYFGYQW